MRLALQWKVLVGYLAVAGIGLGVAGWLALDVIESRDMEHVEAGLTAESRLAAELFAAPLGRAQPDIQEIDMLADRLGEAIKARVTVIASDGKVLGDSYESGDALLRMENHLSRPEVRDALTAGVGLSIRLSSTVGIRMLNAAVPVRSPAPDRRVLGLVRLSLPLTQIEEQHRTLRKALILALAVAFLLSLVLSFLIARSVTRPLAEMVDAAADRLAGSAALSGMGAVVGATAPELIGRLRRRSFRRGLSGASPIWFPSNCSRGNSTIRSRTSWLQNSHPRSRTSCTREW